MVSRWVSAISKWTSETRRKVSGSALVEKSYFQKQRKSFIPGLYNKENKVLQWPIRNKSLEILKEPEMVVLYGNLGGEL